MVNGDHALQRAGSQIVALEELGGMIALENDIAAEDAQPVDAPAGWRRLILPHLQRDAARRFPRGRDEGDRLIVLFDDIERAVRIDIEGAAIAIPRVAADICLVCPARFAVETAAVNDAAGQPVDGLLLLTHAKLFRAAPVRFRGVAHRIDRHHFAGTADALQAAAELVQRVKIPAVARLHVPRRIPAIGIAILKIVHGGVLLEVRIVQLDGMGEMRRRHRHDAVGVDGHVIGAVGDRGADLLRACTRQAQHIPAGVAAIGHIDHAVLAQRQLRPAGMEIRILVRDHLLQHQRAGSQRGQRQQQAEESGKETAAMHNRTPAGVSSCLISPKTAHFPSWERGHADRE